MATPEKTGTPLFIRGQAAGDKTTPGDFRVLELEEPDRHPLNPLTIEAFWGGEAKVSAEVDNYQGTAHIDRIIRPAHWGEDTRPVDEQQAEYELGIYGILGHLIAKEVPVIEIDGQAGLTAAAVLELPVPAGWLRTLKLVSYDVWIEGEIVDIRRAVAGGAVISAKYEAAPAPEEEGAIVIPLPVKPQVHI